MRQQCRRCAAISLTRKLVTFVFVMPNSEEEEARFCHDCLYEIVKLYWRANYNPVLKRLFEGPEYQRRDYEKEREAIKKAVVVNLTTKKSGSDR